MRLRFEMQKIAKFGHVSPGWPPSDIQTRRARALQAPNLKIWSETPPPLATITRKVDGQLKVYKSKDEDLQ
jgi:hypothetical protein